MKKILVLSVAILSIFAVKAQTIAGDSARIEAISMGYKFKLRLAPYDSLTYTYTIESLDTLPKNTVMNFLESDSLFSKKIEKNTIEGYFCEGSFKENSGNNLSLLILKSGMDHTLKYDAAIFTKGDKRFRPTSVVDLYPNVAATEMWPYMIDAIALMWFRKLKSDTDPAIKIDNKLNQ